MTIMYVTMQFPEPSETFATNEVRVLVEHGVVISVHGLRWPHRGKTAMMRERRVEEVETSHNSVQGSLRGLLFALGRPRLLARAIVWSLRRNGTKRRDLLRTLLLLPRAFEILRDVERRRPHVVHMYWGHFPAIVGFLVQAHVPEVVTSMSMVAYDLEREYGGAVPVAREADVLRTHAEVNRDHISRFTGVDAGSVQVIYNGVDVAWVNGITRDVKKVPRRIATVGRLVESKGMFEVLQVLATVHDDWPDATLVVVGDGPDRERLQRIARRLGVAHAVAFIGHVPHARAIEEIARAEVFLLLSDARGERLPNVVKEAMACRSVCVTTTTPGIEELIEHERSGYLVPPRDPAAASTITADVFSGRVDVPSVTARAVDQITKKFSLEANALRYQDLWQHAVQRRYRQASSAAAQAAAESSLANSSSSR